MTIQEAETLYEYEVKKHEDEHNAYKEKMKEKIEKQSNIQVLIGVIFITIGFITLFIVVSSDIWFAFLALIIFGILGGTGLLIYTYITKPKKIEEIENEPISYWLPNKHLYMNYLICTDMNDTYKEYYKQKLADMRYSELALSVDNATSAAAAAADAANDAADMAAISALYNVIKK